MGFTSSSEVIGKAQQKNLLFFSLKRISSDADKRVRKVSVDFN
jgi:hypothetical protein